VNRNPSGQPDPLTREFVRYVFSKQGQETVIKDGYFPIPAPIAIEDLKKVQ
jgi:phosphate transport system substrate-binding protein